MPFKYWRRRRLRSRPIPQAWRDILERKLPYYRCLPPEDRRELEGHIQVFLAEKYFEGCAGLKITDEIRVLIAAQACILLLHRDTDYYPGLRTVLVYPESYLAHDRAVGPAGVVTEGPVWRRGESWHWTIRLKTAATQLTGMISLTTKPAGNRGFWLDPERQGNGVGAGGSAGGVLFGAWGASCTSVGRLTTTVWRSLSARVTARSMSLRAVCGVWMRSETAPIERTSSACSM